MFKVLDCFQECEAKTSLCADPRQERLEHSILMRRRSEEGRRQWPSLECSPTRPRRPAVARSAGGAWQVCANEVSGSAGLMLGFHQAGAWTARAFFISARPPPARPRVALWLGVAATIPESWTVSTTTPSQPGARWRRRNRHLTISRQQDAAGLRRAQKARGAQKPDR